MSSFRDRIERVEARVIFERMTGCFYAAYKGADGKTVNFLLDSYRCGALDPLTGNIRLEAKHCFELWRLKPSKNVVIDYHTRTLRLIKWSLTPTS
jgi:hypothetical protein